MVNNNSTCLRHWGVSEKKKKILLSNLSIISLSKEKHTFSIKLNRITYSTLTVKKKLLLQLWHDICSPIGHYLQGQTQCLYCIQVYSSLNNF